MTLVIYRRHKRTCPNFGKRRGEKQRNCQCKFWVDGILAGREVRMSLETRDVKKANQKVHEWEAKERIVERGAAIGRKAPTHEKLIAAVKQVELGKAKPSPDLLYAIN